MMFFTSSEKKITNLTIHLKIERILKNDNKRQVPFFSPSQKITPYLSFYYHHQSLILNSASLQE